LRAFYAQHDSKTPFLISIVAVTVNIGVNIPLFTVFGVQGLAVGLVISYLTGSILEAVALRRRIARLDGRRIAASVLRIGGAALGMGVVVGVVNELVKSALDPGGLLSNSILVLIPVAAGVAAYGALSMFFGVQELDFVRSAIGRRFHR
jgi:putative peptidoglycan lipid II flippase